MRLILNLIVNRRSIDHRAVFCEFARGLSRVLARATSRARIRAVAME